MTDEIKMVRAECASCGGTRNCKAHGHFQQSDQDDVTQWWVDWRILQCLGCDYVFVQTVSCHSESYDHDENGDIVYDETVDYWPGLAKRKKPEWLYGFHVLDVEKHKLHEALGELYGALENDLTILAAIAIRTSFDVASEILGVDPSVSFEEKLDALVSKGHIGKPDRSRIETLVDAGNASAHRGWRPTPQDLGIMTEILEHFVYEAFVAPFRRAKLDEEAAKIKATVPARPKKAKASPKDLMPSPQNGSGKRASF